MLIFLVFFVIIASALTFGLSRSIYSDISLVNSLLTSKQSYLMAEAALEDAIFKVMAGNPVNNISVINSLTGKSTTTISYDSFNDVYTVSSTAQVGKAKRVSVVELIPGAGSAFNYGLQTGNGGFNLVNSASITGNVFSNGSIVGQGSSIIRGDVISAGPSGLISRITATGTVWTNTLNQSTITGNAYYNVVGGISTVGGVRHIPAAIIPAEALPVGDTKVEEWKTSIQSTGTIIPVTSCSGGWYEININTTIGNLKVECNLRIRKSGASTIVTLTGPVWVVGNIEFDQGPRIVVSPSLGRRSVQIIADNPANRLTSSKISIRNSTEFVGSGHAASHIMVLSQNNSAELGGTEVAIDIGQSSNGALLLYSGHGLINIGNSIFLKSVTAYKTSIGNNSNVVYDRGLANVLFTGGPGGGYVIRSWYQK